MGRRSNFNFSHTCTKIDAGIRDMATAFKNKTYEMDKMVQHIQDNIDVLGEAFDYDVFNLSDLESEVQNTFESVRSTNEDMRAAAEEQINDLINEVDSKDDEIKTLYDQISDKDDEISRLQDRIDSLEAELLKPAEH